MVTGMNHGRSLFIRKVDRRLKKMNYYAPDPPKVGYLQKRVIKTLWV